MSASEWHWRRTRLSEKALGSLSVIKVPVASACDAVLLSSPTLDLTWASSYVMSLPVGQLSVPVPPWGTTGCGAFGKDVCHRTYQDPQTHIPDMYMHKRAANPVPFWKVSKWRERTSPVVQWLRLHEGGTVQSLCEETRTYVPHCVAKKIKTFTNKKIKKK